IPEYRAISARQFYEELVPEQCLIVIRGVPVQWRLVAAARKTPQVVAADLMGMYAQQNARKSVALRAQQERSYCKVVLTDVTYIRGEERVDLFLGRLLELMDREVYPAISIQNAAPAEIFPGLVKDNPSDFFPEVEPRLWIGNEGIVSAHYDGADNVACVVAGRRRFVLFPPEQTGNLYPGPLNFTPAGAPTSMVDLNNPDFDRYPQFKEALANAWSAELNPGDAIFIPMLWWHHVESLEKVNALMNYWWNGSAAKNAVPPSPID